ncbi:MAG: helix-turn-helix domain-containing protein [Oxalobacter sp.]
MSKATGIDRVTLWRFMRGDRLPRLDTLQKILSVLGITAHLQNPPDRLRQADGVLSAVYDDCRWHSVHSHHHERIRSG